MVSINQNEILEIYTDGAARGNPGPAASAFLLVQSNNVLFSEVSSIGSNTNNSAEYHAIINALNYTKKYFHGTIKLYSDSNLAIKQIKGEWKINYPHLVNFRKNVLEATKSFKKVDFFHVGRDNSYIQKCDLLCNKKLDGQL